MTSFNLQGMVQIDFLYVRSSRPFPSLFSCNTPVTQRPDVLTWSHSQSPITPSQGAHFPASPAATPRSLDGLTSWHGAIPSPMAHHLKAPVSLPLQLQHPGHLTAWRPDMVPFPAPWHTISRRPFPSLSSCNTRSPDGLTSSHGATPSPPSHHLKVHISPPLQLQHPGHLTAWHPPHTALLPASQHTGRSA